MDFSAFADFLWEQRGKIGEQVFTHLGLTVASLALAVLMGLPLGILITRRPKWAASVLGITSVLQTIPSIALLGFMIPLLGIGSRPAIVALFLYALLPIVRNAYAGITGVAPHIRDAARGMGMTDGQVLARVELPLALPVIFAGIRTATVINVGVATLAAYIGAGGLGEFIFGGIALNNSYMILAGALPAAGLAIVLDQALGRLQHLRPGQLARWVGGLATVLVLGLAAYAYGNWTTTLRAGFSPEFVGRADGLPNLAERYGLRIRHVVLAPGLIYRAVHEQEVDVIDGYSTDGRIRAYDLRPLDDDQRAFPPYFAAPLVRRSTLRQHPDLADVLGLLAHQIDDSTMMALNYRADYLGEDPAAIARDFLVDQQLYRSPHPTPQAGRITIGSKNFTEQLILVELYTQLIRGYTNLDVQARLGLGGTKICFDALRAGELDLYPEYTGTGLQVILQADSLTVHALDGDPEAVYAHVRAAFRQDYDLEWLQPLGFNNTYSLMMRARDAEAHDIRSISDLQRYLDR